LVAEVPQARFGYHSSSMPPSKPTSPQQQLESFIDRYSPQVAAIARAVLTELRTQLPGATEFVYDKQSSLVIGFGPCERPSEAIISVALYSKWVNLYFIDGAFLPDPEKRLIGTGNQVRRIQIKDASILVEPAVRTLIREAMLAADTPFTSISPRRLEIRAVATRPRSSRRR